MANPAGSFIWYELMTPDPDAIAPFYAAVIGWRIDGASPGQPGGMDYRMIARDDGGSAGGVLRLSADMQQHGARPLWLPYLYTPDVDGTLAAIAAEGGKVQMKAMDLPVGRIAMVTDPQGVPFYLMKPVPPPGKPDAASDVHDRQARQRVNWNELASPDLAASKTFYHRHFGFEFNESMSMGPMGDSTITASGWAPSCSGRANSSPPCGCSTSACRRSKRRSGPSRRTAGRCSWDRTRCRRASGSWSRPIRRAPDSG
jgi:uncharacterized protein